MSSTARQTTGLIANFAAITLTTQFYLRLQLSDTVLAALSYMAQYFTLLTNTMAFILMVWIAMRRAVSPRLVRAVIISIVCFGLIYHRLLAHLVSLSGVKLWADHETHTVVSLLAGIWWLLLAPKPKIKAGDIMLWVAWPLIYCGNIFFRVSFSRFYPYPFLNVPEIG
ncbi:Pr6Pr family membrane protein [Sulfitobacter sp.]|uniref:Pr6Pr family membrane protein n=1 Tax=Sulfitobacter sp. TaxID=1903071 RepID=UPI0030027944